MPWRTQNRRQRPRGDDDGTDHLDPADGDRLELLDRIAERVPELDLAHHVVEWTTLDDGHEALLVDGGGIDGGSGIYFANAGDDLHAVGSLAPLAPAVDKPVGVEGHALQSWQRDAMGRFDLLSEINSLDPERDNQRIVHLSFGQEFPWDSLRALEVALYRTYSVPSISKLLDGTGEFYRAPQRRYDDTAILIWEMCEWGYEEGRGKEALERVNWAHGHFKITNDDFLYVLSTFLLEPIRWIDAFAWRRLSEVERHGCYYFWRGVGRGMHIDDIPPSLEEFEHWSADYEKEHFRFTDTNARVGTATRDLFAAWFPRFTRPVVNYGIYAMLDDAMIESFGFPRPLPGTPALARGALKLRGRLVRWLPPRREPHFFTDGRIRTYPSGYQIGELGPTRLIALEEKRRQGVEGSN